MPAEQQKRIFSANLNQYLRDRGEQQKEVAEKLDISLSTFNSWCTGQKMPRMDKLQKLADYFGVTKSDLIEQKDYQDDFKNKAEPRLRLLARNLEKIPDEQREKVLKAFENTLDIYLDAMRIEKDEED